MSAAKTTMAIPRHRMRPGFFKRLGIAWAVLCKYDVDEHFREAYAEAIAEAAHLAHIKKTKWEEWQTAKRRDQEERERRKEADARAQHRARQVFLRAVDLSDVQRTFNSRIAFYDEGWADVLRTRSSRAWGLYTSCEYAAFVEEMESILAEFERRVT